MSEEKNWKVGDKVKLVSGGPVMAVIGLGTGDFSGKPVTRCKWFDNNNVERISTFPPETLEAASG